MKIIHIEQGNPYKKNMFPELVLALGFFDGVHLGHQQVIKAAVELASKKNRKSAVMTFHPHPSITLQREPIQAYYMTPLEKKTKYIEELGVDYLFIVNFSKEFAELTPQQFVDEYIIGLNVKDCIAGFDFTYGRLGKGTMETLPFHSREEFTISVIEKKEFENEKVSSTRIRTLLQNGEVEELFPLIGRHYRMDGTVIHGDKRGRTIGFPTANIKLMEPYLLPKVGVYGVKIFVKNEWYYGICNIGYKPTFYEKLDTPTIEVHLLNFDEDIYDEVVEVEWYFRIRDEQKFSGIDSLKEQLQKDKKSAEQLFAEKKL